jgi:Lrp/AsnC family transcriptional regulator
MFDNAVDLTGRNARVCEFSDGGRDPSPGKLDRLDMLILDVLQKDVTVPVFDVAERVGSSKSVVWRRIQQMIESGVIHQRVAVLDPRSVGLSVLIFVRVRMLGHSRDRISRFADAMRNCPEVLECHSLLGDVDFILKVVTPSLEHYERFFLKKLSIVEGVGEVTSSVAMSRLVSTTQLPLAWATSVSAGR